MADAQVSIGESGRPRVKMGDARTPWSELMGKWTAAEGRLVILGDPGYGKTVAALTLVEHINRSDSEVVAETFRLAEWHAWSSERGEGGHLEDWLAEQLAQTY